MSAKVYTLAVDIFCLIWSRANVSSVFTELRLGYVECRFDLRCE